MCKADEQCPLDVGIVSRESSFMSSPAVRSSRLVIEPAGHTAAPARFARLHGSRLGSGSALPQCTRSAQSHAHTHSHTHIRRGRDPSPQRTPGFAPQHSRCDTAG